MRHGWCNAFAAVENIFDLIAGENGRHSRQITRDGFFRSKWLRFRSIDSTQKIILADEYSISSAQERVAESRLCLKRGGGARASSRASVDLPLPKSREDDHRKQILQGLLGVLKPTDSGLQAVTGTSRCLIGTKSSVRRQSAYWPETMM